MPVQQGKCIKTGAYVKVLEYGMAQSADVFLVGNTVIIRFADDLMEGKRVEGDTGYEVIIGMTGFYYNGSRRGEKPFIIVPANQFKGEVYLEGTKPAMWPVAKPEEPIKPIRVVADISGGAVHSVSADAHVDVLFISNDSDDVHNFINSTSPHPCLVPLSEDMADPHAHWRWGTNGGSAKVEPDVCDHYFLQLEGV